jgi:hypothetical protein
MVVHFLGEDEIIRGVRERSGPAVGESRRESTNSPREPRGCCLKAFGPSPNGLVFSLWERTIHADLRGQIMRTCPRDLDG